MIKSDSHCSVSKKSTAPADLHLLKFRDLVASIRQTHDRLATQAGKAVNVSLTLRNWVIGHYITEYQLHGADRAKYGENLLTELSKALSVHKVTNTGRRQLYNYLTFYRTYPQIVRTLSAQSLGILLCIKKDHALVEYALAGMDNQLFVSKYQLELPKKEDMQRFIEDQIQKAEK